MAQVGRLRLPTLLLALCIFLSQTTAIDITYPTSDTIYPKTDTKYDIYWSSDSTDPQTVQIYLATYGDSTVNYLQGPETATSEDNEIITFSEGPPPGQYWTWQFYDASQPVQTGANQIAESAHFTFAAAVIPGPKKKGLSAGAAAGIAIVFILLFAAAGGFAFWRYVYRPRVYARRKRHDEALATTPAQAQLYAGKYELGNDGGDPSARLASPEHAPAAHPPHQAPPVSPSSPSTSSPQYELENPTRAQAYHEMAGPHPQRPAYVSPHSTGSASELSPATVAVDRSTSGTRRKPLPTTALGGAQSPSMAGAQVYEM